MFDKLVDEFSSRKQRCSRVVRLDLPHRAYDARGRRAAVAGLEELDACLRDCVRASFESRQQAYMEEVGEGAGGGHGWYCVWGGGHG